MPTVTLRLPRLHAAQRRVVSEAKRFNCLAAGRRTGKSFLGIDLAVHPALGGKPVGWFSPRYKLLTEVWRDLCRLLKPVTVRHGAQEHRLELVTGGVIEMWTLDGDDPARSRRYARVIVDEAAMVRGLTDKWQAAIRPTLTDFKGDAWFFSTPKGAGFFKQGFDWGQDPGRPDWMSWQMPTSVNPYIDPHEIEDARRDMPERIFAQEYLAQFLEDAGGVFRRVLDAATAEPKAEAEPGRTYVVGVDWAKTQDFSCFTVLDTQARAMVALDRFNRVDYVTQRGRLRALCERFRPSAVIAEQNSIGEPIIEQLVREGLPVRPFYTSNTSKSHIIEALTLAFERGDLQILDDPVLVGELQAYQMERLPSGLTRYGAPVGYHDDTVMSLALAWSAVGESLADASPYTTPLGGRSRMSEAQELYGGF